MRLTFIDPCLPSLTDDPPAGEDWIHEVKHDGYRTILIIEGAHVRAFTRNGHDWSHRYRTFCSEARSLSCRSTILDGEMVVLDSRGASDFRALPGAIAHAQHKLTLVAFDILYLDGKDLRDAPLIDRRARLEELVDKGGSCIQFSESFTGDSDAFLRAVDRMGLEGIVSKKAGSRYRSGRSKTWLKTKCWTEDEFDIIATAKTPKGLPVALLAREGAYVGEAIISLPAKTRSSFNACVERLVTETPSLNGFRKRDIRWVRSGLRARARYLRGEEFLRHATMTGFRLANERR